MESKAVFERGLGLTAAFSLPRGFTERRIASVDHAKDRLQSPGSPVPFFAFVSTPLAVDHYRVGEIEDVCSFGTAMMVWAGSSQIRFSGCESIAPSLWHDPDLIF